MSTITIDSAAASPSRAGRRRRLALWSGAGAVLALLAAVLAITLWPDSEADKARSDGERLGEAVSALYAADTADEVDAALADLADAAGDARTHAGDAVAEQVADQQDALARAADGFVGSRTSDDAFSVDLYQAELNAAVDDLADQASEFRTQGPEVQQAFWEGVDEALTTA